MYDESIEWLRTHAKSYEDMFGKGESFVRMLKAADDIEELLKAAKAMHTWIFLHTGDEQKAYDECGLSDEMNSALGYSGQFVMEQPKEEE